MGRIIIEWSRMFMACTSLPSMWVTIAVPFSIMGTLMLSVTVPTWLIFFFVKMDSSSRRALAEPCFPGLDLEMLRIL